MTRMIRYLTHPQVVIAPDVPIQNWSLSAEGHKRVAHLATSGALAGTRHVISSAETKALETARPLAKALGCGLEILAKMHENDRSATGYLPPEAFERAADLFFAHPDQSILGWERATDAQTRIVGEVLECLEAYPDGDLLIVGHGAVGTLLYCHICGLPISRAFDQGPGGGGAFFGFRHLQDRPIPGWRPMEQMIAEALSDGARPGSGDAPGL